MLLTVSKRLEFSASRRLFVPRWPDEDNPTFADIVPTAENIAGQLFNNVAPLFSDGDAKLVAVHLIETPDRSATVYADGTCDANYWLEFSAARQTMSPRLTAAENARIFGESMGIHGHNYRARFSFRKPKPDGPVVQQHDVDLCLKSLRQEMDHRFLNEVGSLKDRPITTERDRKSTRLNSSHVSESRMPSS